MGNQGLINEKEARQRVNEKDLSVLTEIWEILAGNARTELDMHKADILLYVVMKDPSFPRYETKKLKEIVTQITKDFNGFVDKHKLHIGAKRERWGYVFLKLLHSDVSLNDSLSWRSFIAGWAIATSGTLEEKAGACFRLIDYDKDGFLSKDDIHGFLASLKSVDGEFQYDMDDSWTEEKKN